MRASVCVVPGVAPVDAGGRSRRLYRVPPRTTSPSSSSTSASCSSGIPSTGGARTHHVARFVIDMGSDAATIVEQVKSGDIEVAGLGGPAWSPFVSELTERYGVNKPGGHSSPCRGRSSGCSSSTRADPSSRRTRSCDKRSTSRSTAELLGASSAQQQPRRQTSTCRRSSPATATSDLSAHRPDVKKAQQLAKGRTRSGKAVLYTVANPVGAAQAQIVKDNLSKIGLDVEIKEFPAPVLFGKLATLGEPFDIGWIGWWLQWPRWGWSHLRRTDHRAAREPELVVLQLPDLQPTDRRGGRAPTRTSPRARLRRTRRPAREGCRPWHPVRGVERVHLRLGQGRLHRAQPGVDITAVCLK